MDGNGQPVSCPESPEMTESNDHGDLLARWQEHDDRDALEELLRHEVEALKKRMQSAGLGSSSTSDVAQEAVMRFLKAQASFSSPSAMRSYLWTSARNLLVDRLRRSRRAHIDLSQEDTQAMRLDPSTTGELRGVEDIDLQTALELALNLLKAADREILRLIYFEGDTIERAASKLGVVRDVANTRLVRARVRMAEKLGHWRELVVG